MRGAGEVARLAAARAREWAGSSESLVVLLRATTPRPLPDGARGLLLRRLGPADAGTYARSIGTDSETSFRMRLSDGQRCYVVEDAGTVLHASWVTTTAAWTREIRSFVCVQPGDAYVFESFTAPAARGRGVYPFALESVCRALAAEDIGGLWIAVEHSNEPSMRAVRKAGFEQVGEIAYRRRLGVLAVDAPNTVKRDTTARRGSKNPCVWLRRDGIA